MSATRPETVADGLTHRHGCTAPPPKVIPARMTGWDFHRCPACGAARLVRRTT